MMTNDRESSVIVSLRELMTLEDERVADEAAARAAAEAAERDRRLAAERARREAERRRLQEEEDARRAEELRRREDEARLEAVRVAELERARRAREHEARMAELAVARAQEEHGALLRRSQSTRRLKLAMVGNAAALLLGAAVVLVHASHRAARHGAERADLLRQLQDLERKAEQRVREVEAERLRQPALPSAPPSAEPATDDPEPPARRPPPVDPGSRQPPPQIKPAPPQSTCLVGDPMCADFDG